ncbi:MAG: hypothetical protein JO023_08225 [Chloroflexi bacterium]|nr:hypothetical protein [Chloroflexota bacterium]
MNEDAWQGSALFEPGISGRFATTRGSVHEQHVVKSATSDLAPNHQPERELKWATQDSNL